MRCQSDTTSQSQSDYWRRDLNRGMMTESVGPQRPFRGPSNTLLLVWGIIAVLITSCSEKAGISARKSTTESNATFRIIPLSQSLKAVRWIVDIEIQDDPHTPLPFAGPRRAWDGRGFARGPSTPLVNPGPICQAAAPGSLSQWTNILRHAEEYSNSPSLGLNVQG